MKRDFSLFTGLLKTARTDDGMILTGVASSTVKDRHGDIMTANALDSMLRTADGMTIYLNHSYNVPEDVAGTVRSAWIDKASDDLHDLHFEIAINDENPRAVQAFNAIDKGTKLGLSIGAMIPEGGATRDKKSGRYTIDEVELLETSIVSIPANPRSWVDYARKALLTKSDIPETDDDEEPVLKDGEDDPETAPETVTNENLSKAFAETLGVESIDIVDSAGEHPHAHVHDHEHQHGWEGSQTVHSHEHAHVHSHEHDAEHDHQDDQNDWQHDHTHSGSADDHAHDHGGDPDQSSKSADPDTTKAKVTVWPSGKVSVDTTPQTPSQDAAPQADPETEDPDALAAALGEMARDLDPEVKRLLGPTFTASLQSSQQLMLALVSTVEKASERALKAESERDAVVAAAKVLTETTEAFIARVAATPRGRRAVAREIPQTARALEGIRESGLYSEEFMDMLVKGATPNGG